MVVRPVAIVLLRMLDESLRKSVARYGDADVEVMGVNRREATPQTKDTLVRLCEVEYDRCAFVYGSCSRSNQMEDRKQKGGLYNNEGQTLGRRRG
ncbi:hypothetical protein RB195_026481 [Necator americanus]